MLQRLKHFLIASGLLFAGLSLAQEPPAQPDDPPVRFKKKNPSPPSPAKPDPVKPPMPEEKKEPGKKEDAKEDPEPPAPQEEDAEVLARVAKNVRLAEEKIANQELNDGTRQLQEDILKDLDSLIRSAENPQGGGGGGGGGEDQNQDQSNSSDKSKSSGKSQSGPGSMGKQSGKQQGGGSSRASRNKQGNGSQQANKGGKQNGSKGSGNQQANGQPNDPGNQQANKNNGGNNGGGGGGKSMPERNNADLYKDVWGHLPEALRAEMNAYSNDKQFMMKYDELIKRYYRTIAEQGRRKGD